MRESATDTSLKNYGVPTPVSVSMMFHVGTDLETDNDVMSEIVAFNNYFGLKYNLRSHFSVNAGCSGSIVLTIDAIRIWFKVVVRCKSFILLRVRKYLLAIKQVRGFVLSLIEFKSKIVSAVREYWDKEEHKNRIRLRKRIVSSREQGLDKEVKSSLQQLEQYSMRDHIKSITINKIYNSHRSEHRHRLSDWYSCYITSKTDITEQRSELSQLSDIAWRQQGYKVEMQKRQSTLRKHLIELERIVLAKPKFALIPGMTTNTRQFINSNNNNTKIGIDITIQDLIEEATWQSIHFEEGLRKKSACVGDEYGVNWLMNVKSSKYSFQKTATFSRGRSEAYQIRKIVSLIPETRVAPCSLQRLNPLQRRKITKVHSRTSAVSMNNISTTIKISTPRPEFQYSPRKLLKSQERYRRPSSGVQSRKQSRVSVCNSHSPLIKLTSDCQLEDQNSSRRLTPVHNGLLSGSLGLSNTSNNENNNKDGDDNHDNRFSISVNSSSDAKDHLLCTYQGRLSASSFESVSSRSRITSNSSVEELPLSPSNIWSDGNRKSSLASNRRSSVTGYNKLQTRFDIGYLVEGKTSRRKSETIQQKHFWTPSNASRREVFAKLDQKRISVVKTPTETPISVNCVIVLGAVVAMQSIILDTPVVVIAPLHSLSNKGIHASSISTMISVVRPDLYTVLGEGVFSYPSGSQCQSVSPRQDLSIRYVRNVKQNHIRFLTHLSNTVITPPLIRDVEVALLPSAFPKSPKFCFSKPSLPVNELRPSFSSSSLQQIYQSLVDV